MEYELTARRGLYKMTFAIERAGIIQKRDAGKIVKRFPLTDGQAQMSIEALIVMAAEGRL